MRYRAVIEALRRHGAQMRKQWLDHDAVRVNPSLVALLSAQDPLPYQGAAQDGLPRELSRLQVR